MHNEIKEREMREAFALQAKEITGAPEKFAKAGENLLVGLESEVAVFNEAIDEKELSLRRNRILETAGETVDVELGAMQVELRTPPYDILEGGFRPLAENYGEINRTLEIAARQFDVSILRIGSNPFLPIYGTPRTDKLKYRLVPDYNNLYRRETTTTRIGLRNQTIDVGDASIVSLFQSFQVNLEARSLEDAVSKLNRSLMIGPYILALGGNSRYLELTDTGFNDLRILAWELSHDTRTLEEIRRGWAPRMGLPEKYFENIGDYFERIRRYPFILYDPENALKIGIGLYWLDTRIKFIDSSAIVEFRALPTQPTIDEEIAFTLFFLGRMYFSDFTKEPLLPFEMLKENRLSAILYGIQSDFWFWTRGKELRKGNGHEVIRYELRKALAGLKILGFAENAFTDLLKERLENGPPSECLARALKCKEMVSEEEMIEALIKTGMLV